MFIAIGGGSMKEMTAVNDYIVSKLEHIRQEMERKPKIMFLPQASFESKPYVKPPVLCGQKAKWTLNT